MTVAARLDRVSLVRGEQQRSPELNSGKRQRAQLANGSLLFHVDDDAVHVVTLAKFEFKASEVDNTGLPLYLIAAVFQLRFHLEVPTRRLKKVEKDALVMRGEELAWPYWIEYLSNSAARLNLPIPQMPAQPPKK
jgi:hypothetical protein